MLWQTCIGIQLTSLPQAFLVHAFAHMTRPTRKYQLQYIWTIQWHGLNEDPETPTRKKKDNKKNVVCRLQVEQV